MGAVDMVYIAAIHISPTEGISKKIISQAKGFSKVSKKCLLICYENERIVKIEIINGVIKKKTTMSDKIITNKNSRERIAAIKELLNVAQKLLYDENKYIYIRHMIPTIEYIKFLRFAKKMKYKVGYEIPTYPYYYEQFKAANNKIKSFVKIVNDILFWPFIYKNVNKIFVIVSNSKVKIFSKMHLIKNGVEIDEEYRFEGKVINNSFELIGVGTIWPYHGYNRIIDAIEECNGFLANGLSIRFHIVGESQEISKLERECKDRKLLDYVIFHGKKFGNDLERLYIDSHIGVGTLALKKRNADIDTAIKNIEYFSRSLPVISSGKVFNICSDYGVVYIADEDNDLDLNSVYYYYKHLMENNPSEVFEKIISEFTWDHITSEIITSYE